MGILDLLGSRSLEAILRRARRLLATGDFPGALQAVERGLERYPDSEALRDTGHAARRAQARAGVRSLEARVDAEGTAAVYEELLSLYVELGMRDEADRLAARYAGAHPSLESPHLHRGAQALDTFFADLRSVDGHAAIAHLLKAASIRPDALRPRLLLAEVFFAVGADKAMLGQAAAIRRIAGDDAAMAPILRALHDAAHPSPNESVDALLARVEVSRQLVRDPSPWSSRPKRGAEADQDARRVARRLDRLVREDDAEEALAMDRTGTATAVVPERLGDGTESALAGIARAVVRTVKTEARELEMGAFRRCVVEGPFGVMLVADARNGVVAARAIRGTDPLRLHERLNLAVNGVAGRSAS